MGGGVNNAMLSHLITIIAQVKFKIHKSFMENLINYIYSAFSIQKIPSCVNHGVTARFFLLARIHLGPCGAH